MSGNLLFASWARFPGYQGTVSVPYTYQARETAYDRNSPLVTKTGSRTYGFYSHPGLSTSIKIDDTATPFLSYLARTFPEELNKALGALGWMLKNEIQDSIYGANPPGASWPPLSDIQTYRVLDDVKREKMGKKLRAPATNPFGALVRAVGYRRDKHAMKVQIGWLSASAASWALKLQKGFSTEVTPQMRRFFAASGLGIPKGGTIETPGRDLIGPIFEHMHPQFGPFLERKVGEYLRGAAKRAA